MEIFDIIKSVIFGIVEGITEWLPISSTGHMILLNEILPLRIGKNPDDFYSMFEVVIQLGAILAVVVLFWSQIWPFGRKNNKAPLAKTGIGAWVKTDIFVLWFHILVSTVPAAIIGILFDDVFERLFYNFQTVAIMLILFGIAFIVIETRHNGKSAKINSLVDISYTTALMIGFFQLIAAVFPGTSRSGATIVGALLNRYFRLEFRQEYRVQLLISQMLCCSRRLIHSVQQQWQDIQQPTIFLAFYMHQLIQ